MDNLFILKAISLKEKTEEDLKRDFDIVKIKYNVWKYKTLKEYIEFEKGWNRDKFNINTENILYSLDKMRAKELLIKNVADFNDGGAYNYAILLSIPQDTAYAELTDINEYELFKYNQKTSTYELITDLNDEKAQYIISTLIH